MPLSQTYIERKVYAQPDDMNIHWVGISQGTGISNGIALVLR